MIKILTGMLSRTGIILVIFYFALFFFVGQVAAVEYSLPYPGILPDSPVYFLKVIRDQVVTFFITNPGQRSFYLVFLSDKRLAAGEALARKGNRDLAATTFLRSEDYFKQAVDLATRTNNQDLWAKLLVSGAKHSEILAKANMSKAYQDNLEDRKRIMELLLATGH